MSNTMSHVCTGSEYARRVNAHLDAGGSPNVFSLKPHYLHSLLGLACHKGQAALVSRLLAAGANPHWPQDTVSRRKWGDETGAYDGVFLDPLGVCLDMLAGYLDETPDGAGAEKGVRNVRQYVAIAKHLLDFGANPLRPDPAYRTRPFVRLQRCFDRAPVPTLVRDCFLELMLHAALCPAAPPGSLKCMAQGQWQELGFIQKEWSRQNQDILRQLASLAQSQVLSAAPPAIAHSRLRRM